MGFAGVIIPEEHGGSGLGAVEAGVVMEELGRTLTPSPFLSTARAVGVTRSEAAARDAQQAALAAADRGGRGRSPPWPSTRAPSTRRRGSRLTAERSGNGFKLNGAKGFVLDGHVADLLIVAARTAGAPGEQDGLTLFLVDPKTAGRRDRAHRHGRRPQRGAGRP